MFKVNNKYIYISIVSIVNFEQVNAGYLIYHNECF